MDRHRIIQTGRRQLTILDVARLRGRYPGAQPHDEVLQSLLRSIG